MTANNNHIQSSFGAGKIEHSGELPPRGPWPVWVVEH